ncbi:uncharacterized protein LOC142347879 isoform X2 [Convolutriloba macropyga]|uniref:uncharacterized protein LOC142347879 isoform X2 n=1 Tax=Convolutriloba macropyga TaxID=536237 RepID=UPI003F51C455
MEMVRDRHHGAERQTKTKPRLLTNCSAFAIPYLGGQNKSEWRLLEDVQRAEGLWASYLFFEGPLKWANGYLYRLVCQNPGSHISYLTYVIPMEFQQFNAEWKEKYDDVDYIDGTGSKMGSYTLLVAQWGIIPTMVSSGSLTSVDMTRKETLLNGHLDHVEVVTQIATTMFREEALLGLTTISWRWVDGHILRVKNVRRDSYYSLAFILCTVLLAVERSYTFLLRARRGKQQEVQDSKDDHYGIELICTKCQKERTSMATTQQVVPEDILPNKGFSR